MNNETLVKIFNAYTVNGHGATETREALLQMLATDPAALAAAQVLAERMAAPLAAANASRKAADDAAARAEITRRNLKR